jgi:hypothetical protein
MKRDLLDLISKPHGLLRRLRSVALGGALTSLGLLPTTTVAASEPTFGSLTEPAITPTIMDRAKKKVRFTLSYELCSSRNAASSLTVVDADLTHRTIACPVCRDARCVCELHPERGRRPNYGTTTLICADSAAPNSLRARTRT